MTYAGWGPRALSRKTSIAALAAGGALLAQLLAASCDSGASQRASHTTLPDAAVDGATDAPMATSSDASNDSDDAWSGDSHRDPGVDLDATNLDGPGPDPAPVACAAVAAEAGSCPFPHSVCADRSWLVFYDNPRCIADSCAWDKRYLDCGNVGCFAGQCQPPFTM
jgi:hypothetical protein